MSDCRLRQEPLEDFTPIAHDAVFEGIRLDFKGMGSNQNAWFLVRQTWWKWTIAQATHLINPKIEFWHAFSIDMCWLLTYFMGTFRLWVSTISTSHQLKTFQCNSAFSCTKESKYQTSHEIWSKKLLMFSYFLSFCDVWYLWHAHFKGILHLHRMTSHCTVIPCSPSGKVSAAVLGPNKRTWTVAILAMALLAKKHRKVLFLFSHI